MRGTTRVHNVRGLVVDISTHVPHAGHDRLALGRVILVCGISTHVPHAGHDGRDADKLRNAVDFNSRAPCGARPPRLRSSCPHTAISTHVPHAGHDEEAETKIRQVTNFNSRAPCGARRLPHARLVNRRVFQLTCPMRGTTCADHCGSCNRIISTHVPHAGHDGRVRVGISELSNFNSRAPCGARHCDSDTVAPSNPFQLTCPMRGTTDDPPAARLVSDISTHVPHAGHDVIAELIGDTVDHFNSRAPCGARLIKEITQHILNGFQLTCPMRGTTNKFYNNIATVNISTHVPHAGHDCSYRRPSAFHFSFQLTCPMRGTTWSIEYRRGRSPISTHVPHAGHDCGLCGQVLPQMDFNSRAPCGARPRRPKRLWSALSFQLTCPMRGTTESDAIFRVEERISTHVPHAGHDRDVLLYHDIRHISTHVPHAGHDDHGNGILVLAPHFNSRAPCGARRQHPSSLRRFL